jgi:hypothetical protein
MHSDFGLNDEPGGEVFRHKGQIWFPQNPAAAINQRVKWN